MDEGSHSEEDSANEQRQVLKMLHEVSQKKKAFEEAKINVCEADYTKRRGLMLPLRTAYENYERIFQETLEMLRESKTTNVSQHYFIVCVQSLLQVELAKVFHIPISVDFSGMNEALKRTICEGVTSRALTHLSHDSIGSQIIDLSVDADDLRRKVTRLEKKLARLSYRQIANVLKNRLELELNKFGFFDTEERQLKDFSMTDYHFMFVRYQNKRDGERFTQPQAKAYATLLSTAFPTRFGDKRMVMEELSKRVAELFSGVLEFARDVVHDNEMTETEVQHEVDVLKEEDIKGLKKPFKVQDIRDLFAALKIAHRRVGASSPLLAVEEIQYPQLTYTKGEFDDDV